jgi:hypothetical protein
MRKPASTADIHQRKRKLKNYGVRLSELNSEMLNAVVGDNLTFKYPKTIIRDIRERYAKFSKLKSIYANPGPNMLQFVECDQPNSEILEALSTYHKHYERIVKNGRIIFGSLLVHLKPHWPTWRGDLAAVNSVFHFGSALDLNWEISNKDLLAKVIYEFQMEHPSTDWVKVFAKKCYETLWKRGRKYPEYMGYKLEHIIPKIKEFMASTD